MVSTQEAADRIGVSKATLLRWLSSGLIRDVERDQRCWRIWSDEEIAHVRRFKDSYRHSNRPQHEDLPTDVKISRLQTLTVSPGRRYQEARLPQPEQDKKIGVQRGGDDSDAGSSLPHF